MFQHLPPQEIVNSILTTSQSGTWQSAPGEVKNAVAYALKNGYRHIDAAYCYGNEDEVGQGLKEAFDSGIKREDIFVTTKLWCTYHTRAAEGLEKSLKSLGLDYVDLFLMHWPVTMNSKGNNDRFPTKEDGSRDITPRSEWDHTQTYLEMEKLLKSGKTKAIGVSNYSKRYLEELLPKASVVPAVNQIENHPSLPQQEIRDYCKEKGILITAYSPLGSTGSPMFKTEEVVKVAEKKGVSPASVLLSYHSIYIPFLRIIKIRSCANRSTSRRRQSRPRQIRYRVTHSRKQEVASTTG